MAAPDASTVTPFELAVLVLHYLESSGFAKTSQWFRREARSVMGTAATSLPAGVKNLSELLNDYVAVRERESRRQQLQVGNPVAQSLYSLLDFHAGLPVPQRLPPAFYSTAADSAGAAPSGQPAPNQPPHTLPSMIPVQAPDLSYPTHPDSNYASPGASPGGRSALQQQQEAAAPRHEQGQHTPGRHAHRKGAPRKRRKLQDALDCHAGAWGGPGGATVEAPLRQPNHGVVLPIVRAREEREEAGAAAVAGVGFEGGTAQLRAPLDLLNMQLDEEGLMSLLCDDDLQVRFASGLAQHITLAMNHHPPAAGSTGLSGAGSGSGEDVMLASIDDMLADLPTDPHMAQLLQHFVRVDGGGGVTLGWPPATVSGAATLSHPAAQPDTCQLQQQQLQQQQGNQALGQQQRQEQQPAERQFAAQPSLDVARVRGTASLPTQAPGGEGSALAGGQPRDEAAGQWLGQEVAEAAVAEQQQQQPQQPPCDAFQGGQVPACGAQGSRLPSHVACNAPESGAREAAQPSTSAQPARAALQPTATPEGAITGSQVEGGLQQTGAGAAAGGGGGGCSSREVMQPRAASVLAPNNKGVGQPQRAAGVDVSSAVKACLGVEVRLEDVDDLLDELEF